MSLPMVGLCFVGATRLTEGSMVPFGPAKRRPLPKSGEKPAAYAQPLVFPQFAHL